MKKNGKKARKLQKERNLRRSKMREEQALSRTDEIDLTSLSMSQLLPQNPVLCDTQEMRDFYLKTLQEYVRLCSWQDNQMVKAQLKAYEKLLANPKGPESPHPEIFYRFYLWIDFLFITLDIRERVGGKRNSDKLTEARKRFCAEFAMQSLEGKLLETLAAVAQGEGHLRKLAGILQTTQEQEYLLNFQRNLQFRSKKPFTVMITANMSAGKSTFINALTGKHVCRSQNMACTSKIHTIVNKVFEDGVSYEYDHDLVLTAGTEELMNDNEENTSDKIIVATKFDGSLCEERLQVNDSPGVNFNGAPEHKEITERMLQEQNYDLLIYIMNATQLGTTDEATHLKRVQQLAGKIPILFVINKMDAVNAEEENVLALLQEQWAFLQENGFVHPAICPVSSKAAFLVKRFAVGNLSRSEERELYCSVDKFEKMNLPAYYAKAFPKVYIKDAKTEEEQLLKTSGFAYVEKLIDSYLKRKSKR